MNDHTILCVDDEENILRSLKRLFMEDDWELITANSGELGLEIVKEKPVHLIIADYRMPEMTGVEFLKKAKEIRPNAIRIILSGFADVEAILKGINEGEIYKFISKPWNDEELRIAVRRSLEQFELIRENTELNETIRTQNEELRSLNENLEAKVRERTAALQLRNQALSLAQDMLEKLPVGVAGISLKEEIALINNEMVSIFGLAGKPILGMKVEQCFPERVREIVKDTLRAGDGLEFPEYGFDGCRLNLKTCVIEGPEEPRGIMVIARAQAEERSAPAQRISPRENSHARAGQRIHKEGS